MISRRSATGSRSRCGRSTRIDAKREPLSALNHNAATSNIIVQGQIRIKARNQGNKVVVEISDNGRGIERRDQARIFELFRRAGTQDRPGEGMGLAHVRALVRRLGGSITVDSTPGEGSVFHVSLPRTLHSEGKRISA